jgi:hypothetical protein
MRMLCRCFADLLVVALLGCEGVTVMLQSLFLRCVDKSALLLIFGTFFSEPLVLHCLQLVLRLFHRFSGCMREGEESFNKLGW